MKKFFAIGLLAVIGSTSLVGCARPGEFGWTPAYTAKERGQLIARNWDYEGKQAMDDIDKVFMLRPASHLTEWNLQ